MKRPEGVDNIPTGGAFIGAGPMSREVGAKRDLRRRKTDKHRLENSE